MPLNRPVRIRIMGQHESPEMHGPCDWLRQQSDVECVFVSSDSEVSSDEPTDLIVVLETSPAQFSSRLVTREITCHPLVRIVCLQGYWSEAAGRTTPDWPEAVRVPARSSIPRLALELDVIHGICPPLPLTAGRDELFLFMQTPASRFPSGDCCIQVESCDPAWKGTVERWFQTSSRLSNAGSSIDAPGAVIVDLDPWSYDSELRIQSIRKQHRNTPLIGVGHWLPNADEHQLVPDLLDAIVGRLCPLWYLEAVVSRLAGATYSSNVDFLRSR